MWPTAIVLAVLGACADVDTFDDVGNVLIVPRGTAFDAEDVAFDEGLAIDVRARSGVKTAACDEEESTCEIEVGDDALVITATFERRRPATPCRQKSDGHLMVAECASEPVPAGAYTVHYGGDTAELVIPSQGAPLQVGPDVPDL